MIRALITAMAVTSAAPVLAYDYYAVLSGAQEVPPVATQATGRGFVTLTGNQLGVELFFRNLTQAPVAAHIHCCAPPGANAGVAVNFSPLPASITGSYIQTFDLDLASTYVPGFLAANGGTAAGAKARLLGGFEMGTAYFNVHTPTFPGGEIRGQIGAVPEPGTWAMMILGFGAVGIALRKRPARAATLPA